MQRVPRNAVFASLGIAACIALISLAATLRSSTTVARIEAAAGADVVASGDPSAAPDAPEEPPSQKASTEQIEAARTQGLNALAALAKRYPNDPAVLHPLLMAYARSGTSSKEAVATVERLVELEPAKAREAQIQQVLLKAANGKPDVSSAAIEVISKKMGSVGPDLLYELVIGSSTPKDTRDRANKLLQETDVRKLGSFALLVADDLRRSGKCATKDVVDRARDQGDARSLPYLQAMTAMSKCGFLGFSKCPVCLKINKEANAAIEAIDGRQPKTENQK